MPRLSLALKALRELGPRQVSLYITYQILLRSGYLRWKMRDRSRKIDIISLRFSGFRHLCALPDSEALKLCLGEEGISALLAEADQIVDGYFRRFGVEFAPITLTPPGELFHWIDYETGHQPWGAEDPKFIWEPARFGWAFLLGRAYSISGDECYAESFWRYFEIFRSANPANRGQNWTSAQEVALRILAFTFAGQVFASSSHSTSTRNSQLISAIAQHADRIPPSLLYARAQNNNHLLSEAAGLITAGLALPDHLQARRWSHLGWKWFNRGLRQQIDSDGAYSQHSTNYHRLMLQLALWVYAIQNNSESAALQLEKPSISKLQLATRWLITLTDRAAGRVPNLGPNDGAYILPLSVQPYDDYRPVLQAASQAFFDEPTFEAGVWDEMSLWFSLESFKTSALPANLPNCQPLVIRNSSYSAWAYLRTARFNGRPGHADQLHLDLWWRGLNIAQDAGTYLYNAAQPWDNSLTRTQVHNTLTINDQEQMTRAGRFLYLDRAQAKITAHENAKDDVWQRVCVQHDGYRKLGITHRRTVTTYVDDRWLVTDEIIPVSRQSSSISARLHWLLPDWPWKLDETELKLELESPHGWISLQITPASSLQPATCNLQLVRAGKLLAGNGDVAPYIGWVSPTYAHKVPALSWGIEVEVTPPFSFTSEWHFPKSEQ